MFDLQLQSQCDSMDKQVCPRDMLLVAGTLNNQEANFQIRLSISFTLAIDVSAIDLQHLYLLSIHEDRM